MDNLSSNDEKHKSKIYTYIENGIISIEIFIIVLLIGTYLQTPILSAIGYVGILLSMAAIGYWNLKLSRPDFGFIQRIIAICCGLTLFLLLFGGTIYSLSTGTSTNHFNKSEVEVAITFVIGIMIATAYLYCSIYCKVIRNVKNKKIILLLLLLMFVGIVFFGFFGERIV